MYYIFGDIHGSLNELLSLYNRIKQIITDKDILIFLGDYIDRGLYSYEVIEFLLSLSKIHNSIFLKGNHEDMLIKYKGGDDPNIFISNGGLSTLKSYKNNIGSFRIPGKHQQFYNNLKYYFEAEDFIAVHAGLNPDINEINDQSQYDLLWIREQFYRSDRKWNKTIIFGHTICSILHGKLKDIYFNDKANIIGIDTGAYYGGALSCIRWPDKIIFQG